MEHLSLEIFDRTGTGSKYATLPENTTITIIDTSEVFASGDVWSYSFSLNIPANAHIFGSAGDMHGSRLHEQINKRRARLWVEGLPLYLGYLKLDDEVEVDNDGNIDVSFESGQKTFDEMIEGAKANQVPLMGDVQIGMALWRKRWVSYKCKLRAVAKVADIDLSVTGKVTHGNNDEWFDLVCDGEEDGNSVQEYPRMVFSNGDFKDYYETDPDIDDNFLNTDYPYDDAHPYCNVPLCYQKYGYERKDKNGNVTVDYSGEPEAQRGYEYMPANRVNSAPNFFVIYWLKSLMKHLGIYIEENQMMDIEDLRRLFFVNTKCAYEEPKKLRTATDNTRYGRYLFGGDGRLIPEYINSQKNINFSESGFAGKDIQADTGSYQIENVAVEVYEIEEWSSEDKERYIENNSYFHKAFATSDCFPDVDISEAIEAIESGFGIRFLFSDNYQRVRIVLLRNIFRSNDMQDIKCDIISDTKQENCVRGFRMTYGNTEDTHFYYKGFADMLPHIKTLWPDTSDTHDYSHWDLDAAYADIINKVSAFNKTCYVTPNTGSAYGIKIDKDAKRYDDLHPSLFEYAGFMDAEDGDCTGEEETIETINVGFVPAIMNDLNMENERKGIYDQRFALFVDEEMRPRRPKFEDGKDYNDSDAVYDIDELYAKFGPDSDNNQSSDGIVKPGEFAIASDMYAGYDGAKSELFFHAILPQHIGSVNFNFDGHINEGYHLYLQDNYEPNDDGICPIEKHDWGLTLGIMRGSGSDAHVEYSADTEDKEGNDTWEVVPGSNVTSHPDTCDNYGNEWDYDGSFTVTPANAGSKIAELFPDSDAPFNNVTLGYITNTTYGYWLDSQGRKRLVLIASEYSIAGITVTGSGDMRYWSHLTLEELLQVSSGDRHMVIEVDSSPERGYTLVQLCKLAYGGGTEPMTIDNGVGSRYGRFSLKLRAEKPNPYFNPEQAESSVNRRYLSITNENLRRRGLADEFYKEYSKWVREARIANREVRMELAQLLSIDKTKRVTIGDIKGFIKKMEYTVSNQTGLGNVKVELMYI